MHVMYAPKIHACRKDGTVMSTYPISELLHRWKQGQLTAEQAIGHLLQHVETLTQQQADHERRLRQCEQRPTGKT